MGAEEGILLIKKKETKHEHLKKSSRKLVERLSSAPFPPTANNRRILREQRQAYFSYLVFFLFYVLINFYGSFVENLYKLFSRPKVKHHVKVGCLTFILLRTPPPYVGYS